MLVKSVSDVAVKVVEPSHPRHGWFCYMPNSVRRDVVMEFAAPEHGLWFRTFSQLADAVSERHFSAETLT